MFDRRSLLLGLGAPVSDQPGRASPMIIHNIGGGAREADALLNWPITGRYRWRLA